VPGSDTSARRSKRPPRGAAARRSGADALTAQEALAVVHAQGGKTTPEIAALMDVSQRQVRRLLASARAHGAETTRPEPAASQDAATGRFEPDKPAAGRVRTIGLTGGGGAPAMMIRPETREEYAARFGPGRKPGDPDVPPEPGRGALGKEYSVGELERDLVGNATGRVLVGSTVLRDSGERRRALDVYNDQARLDEIAEHAPPGARFAIDSVTGQVYELEEATA
jgi:DNA-binding CsgD family transcriptional regulator